MSNLPHLPALRFGRAYASLDQTEVKDLRTGAVLATVSQINAGILRKDLARAAAARAALKQFTVSQLLDLSAKAADVFINDTLPLGDQGQTQSPQKYVETLSATSGLPHVMVRRNLMRIHTALASLRVVLNGLTRGLDLSLLDRGFGEQFGTVISYHPTTDALGLVMPSNSPAVNSLWLPALALKTPVVLKPGREEPWTPWRLIQSFITAGVPAEAFGFYPTDREGAATILNTCGRSLLFGDKSTTDQYAHNRAVELHGPGHSKILIGDDQIERWPEFIEVMVDSIAANGGRSCLNASAILVPKYAAEIAEALAQRLGPLAPLPVDDEHARLAAFANPKMADFIDAAVEDGLKASGAEDVTARHRDGPRKVVFEGATYIRPTIIRCDNFAHPLANREFLCPYASVVQVPQAEMLTVMSFSLVATAITQDAAFTARLLDFPLIERLNLGPISTMKISWDQPHEGNLFEFLWRRRSFEHLKLPA
jgi:acyl-CoA reductase-like NAD-dependent aldehyde dehydrogenase